MITPEKLLEAAKQLEPQLQEWRRTLHRHPEVGFDLPQTKALVKKALTETATGENLPIRKGESLFIPAGTGEYTVSGTDLKCLRTRV